MSNEKTEKKTEAPAYHRVIPVSLRGTEIPVRSMRFVASTDVPGKSVTDGLEGVADPRRPRGPHHEIAFVPQLRHHVIAYVQAEKETLFAFVHETQVQTWVPA